MNAALPSNGIRRDEWLAAVEAVAPVPIVDDSALTSVEFGRLVGLSGDAARRRLAKLVQAGKAERVTKHIPRAGDGALAPVSAYRLVK